MVSSRKVQRPRWERYTSRSGGGDDAVVRRPSTAQIRGRKAREVSEYEIEPKKPPHTTYEARVALAEKAHKLNMKTRPRPQSATRAVWKDWEKRIDKERTIEAVTVMCNRAKPKSALGGFAKRSYIKDVKVPTSNLRLIENEAIEAAEENVLMKTQKSIELRESYLAKQNALKTYQGRDSRASGAGGTRKRPTSALPSKRASSTFHSSNGDIDRRGRIRPGSAIVRGSPKNKHNNTEIKRDFMDRSYENVALDLPGNGWGNAESVAYDTTHHPQSIGPQKIFEFKREGAIGQAILEPDQIQ